MYFGIDYTAAVRQRAGIGRYTRCLVQALARIDTVNEYALLVPRDARYAASLENDSFRVRALPLTERQAVLLWQRARLPLPVETWTGRLDLFYSPDFVLPPTRTERRVLTVHDFSYVRVPECHFPGNLAYLNAAVPRAVARARLILADSEATRRDLAEIYGVDLDRIETLYSGVEEWFRRVADENELARVRAAYKIERPFLLSVGTVEPRKNYVRLIEAFARLPQKNDLDLLIAGGPGWLTEDIYAAPARFGVTDRVRMLGFVPDADLPALYTLAALFAYPSLYEGFGLPVLEALACGAPVVASNTSSIPEVAGDAARLVDPRDIEALTHEMECVLTDRGLRAELAQRGPQQAHRFSWDASARQLRAALERTSA